MVRRCLEHAVKLLLLPAPLSHAKTDDAKMIIPTFYSIRSVISNHPNRDQHKSYPDFFLGSPCYTRLSGKSRDNSFVGITMSGLLQAMHNASIIQKQTISACAKSSVCLLGRSPNPPFHTTSGVAARPSDT